jgi:hypothetical protein
MQDIHGNPVGTQSQAALDHAERALWRMTSFFGDPLPDLDAASDADPRWALPWVMRAGFVFSLTEPAMLADARAALERGAALLDGAPERERGHAQAVRAGLGGDWDGACDRWDAILVAHPRDGLALLLAHLFDFYRGDARNLRLRVARVLPEWPRDDPMHAYVLGMHAFGLEECNLYPEAEDAGRQSLAGGAKVPWAVHAVAHVMEMQGRHDDGARWLVEQRGGWADDNGFAFHNWWHLALFHLERLDTARALAIHDERLAGEANQAVNLQRLDGVALLWRLRLLGVEGGERWRELADRYRAAADAGYYAFNDLFALIALVGAGDVAGGERWLERARDAAAAERGANRAMATDVGLPLMRAVLDFEGGRFDDAADALYRVRPIAHRFGGSHAQRDLIDQTLMAAAARGSRNALGRALLNERALAKARTPLTEHWAATLGTAPG